MNFGGRTPKAEALAVISAAIDAGIDLLDTANVYGDGASERIVGEAMRGSWSVCSSTPLAPALR